VAIFISIIPAVTTTGMFSSG